MGVLASWLCERTKESVYSTSKETSGAATILVAEGNLGMSADAEEPAPSSSLEP